MKNVLPDPGWFVNMKIITIFPWLMLCLLTQGCVGVGLARTKTQTFQEPPNSATAYMEVMGYHGPIETNVNAYTPTWLEAHWGKPAKIRRDADAEEIWTYKFGPIWNGVDLAVLFPIPVEVPVGRKQVKFIIRDGQVIRAEQRQQKHVGGYIGYSAGPCGISGFGVHSSND